VKIVGLYNMVVFNIEIEEMLCIREEKKQWKSQKL
jgi:hypothetical protein